MQQPPTKTVPISRYHPADSSEAIDRRQPQDLILPRDGCTKDCQCDARKDRESLITDLISQHRRSQHQILLCEHDHHFERSASQ